MLINLNFFFYTNAYFRKGSVRVPLVAQWFVNLTRNHEVEGLIPGLAQWVGDPVLL